MLNSNPITRAGFFAVTLLACALFPRWAHAQQATTGFSVERFYPSAPGGGWFVMDNLQLGGKLGGSVALVGGYSREPMHVGPSDGSAESNVVSRQAFASVAMAVLFDRYRFYLNIDNPLLVRGKSGTVDGHRFVAPNVDLAKYPDKVTDFRIGVDALLLGDLKGPLRLGLGAQLFIPSGERATYVTDGTYRAMTRLLFAGDFGRFTYAGQLGAHIRPRNDSGVPDSPMGSELLFGLAAAPRFPLGGSGKLFAVIGPELYGETAFNAFLGSHTAGAEVLLAARLERTDDNGALQRFKFGFGEGIYREFGAPAWRCVLAVELLGRAR